MADPAELRQELEEATRHMVDSHARIARQCRLIGQLSAEGQVVTGAEDLLRTMEQGLEAMQAHRQHIVRKLWRDEDEQR
jgi:hypothetical protein